MKHLQDLTDAFIRDLPTLTESEVRRRLQELLEALKDTPACYYCKDALRFVGTELKCCPNCKRLLVYTTTEVKELQKAAVAEFRDRAVEAMGKVYPDAETDFISHTVVLTILKTLPLLPNQPEK